MTAQLLAENEQLAWPVVADIPAAGTALLTGQPVATVFADGASREEVVRRPGGREVRLLVLGDVGDLGGQKKGGRGAGAGERK